LLKLVLLPRESGSIDDNFPNIEVSMALTMTYDSAPVGEGSIREVGSAGSGSCYELYGTLAGLYLGVSILLRLVLWTEFGRSSGVHATSLVAILPIGIVNDLVECIYLLMPVSLYLALMPRRFLRSKLHSMLFHAFCWTLVFGLIYLQAVEYFFFEEFDSRFNLIAVDYVMYPHEVLINLWDSYPIVWALCAAAALCTITTAFLWPRLKTGMENAASDRNRPVRAFFLHAVALTAVTGTISTGTFSYLENRVANQIGANGISSLFEALRTSHLDYYQYYATLQLPAVYKTVRNELAGHGGLLSTGPENLNRRIKPAQTGLGKLNVVVLIEESLGAGFIGAYGDHRGLSPHIDALSRQGLYFENAYATGTRTVRGLEAISSSFPPIPSESIVKRPGNENIANWGAVMNRLGYNSTFLYGGFGLFDNMNYFFRNNGFAIQDRLDITHQTFANIWGVCDEDLFNHALEYFDGAATEGKPFFSMIMTTSNHKPYTFPDGIEGIPATGGGRDAGVRYADYAIGKFWERAQKKSWFGNTVFVIVADHDARVYGRAEVPVERYRIPLLILAPGKIQPKVIDKMTSQIDIAPTVLGLLGLEYEAPFYGADVLSPDVPANKPILLNHNHDVAMLEDGHLLVLGLQREVTQYRYDPGTHQQQREPIDPELSKRTVSIYQSAFDQYSRQLYRLNQPNRQ
jgi:phosphoglycerol transferase MdoB-like AlkP superfamily enzyme